MVNRPKLNCVLVATMTLLLVTHNINPVNAKRSWSGGNSRKTGSGGTSHTPSSSNHGVTKPTYQSSGNSHADAAKLSYPNYNSQPNHPPAAGSQNSQPIGWNVPKQQGPPPAYSASNPVGGAKTNMHEPPPVYHSQNNAAPPSYGTHNSYPSQNLPQGATYHSPGSLPAGATYYPSAGQVPHGSLPAGASYYPSSGHVPPGASYYPAGGHMPGGSPYYPSGGVPAGATYLPAGASLPAGATYYAQPPQSSSGLGFGSGLAAGAIGGALLGHALTPTHTRVVESSPAGNSGSGGEDKIIIINNGPPGSVQTQSAGAGTTVITTGGALNSTAGQEQPPVATSTGSDPAVPIVPLAPIQGNNPANGTEGNTVAPAPVPASTGEQPPAGGIICVPVRTNETDPADNTKMIEVEKIACYPAPPPPPPVTTASNDTNTNVPLMPMSPVADGNTQQLQLAPTQTPLLPDNAAVRTAASGSIALLSNNYFASLIVALLLTLKMSY